MDVQTKPITKRKQNDETKMRIHCYYTKGNLVLTQQGSKGHKQNMRFFVLITNYYGVVLKVYDVKIVWLRGFVVMLQNL